MRNTISGNHSSQVCKGNAFFDIEFYNPDNRKIMRLTLVILCIIEVLLITFLSNVAGPYVSPFLLLSTSLAIAFLFYKAKSTSHTTNQNKYGKLAAVTIFFIVSVFMFYKVHSVNVRFPVSEHDVSTSDVIPTIIVFVKRFVNGEFPYTIMDFGHHSLFPTYLPFTWLPYTAAELFNFDYRWIPMVAFWLVSLFLLLRSISKHYSYRSPLALAILPVGPLLVWCTIVGEDEGVIKYLVEALVAGYYLLLVFSLSSRNLALMAIALSLCLLSRYSVVIWVPLLLLVLWFKERRQFLIVTSILALFFILFYWLPFLRIDPQLYQKGYEYYTTATLSEWRVALYDNGYWHMGNGLGFTKLAIKLMAGVHPENLVKYYKLLHLVAICCTVLAFALYFIKYKHRINTRKFLLFSLKSYLTIFYAFVQVPYKYLFIVPVVISCALLLHLNRNDTEVQI